MNHLVDQYFDSLSDKKVAVLGIGVSNRPLIRMLLARGIHVLACDKTPREKLDAEVLELEQAGAVLHVGEGYLDDVRADVVFRTPGMHPEIPALRRLRAAGAEITSEMEAFFEVCPCRIIAVTGSDGKTTTTTLIAKILEHAGHRVWIGGNIGAPLLPQAAEMTPTDLAVVELSSFQLMSMERSADIAVVTNVAPNHLDVHKDMAEYVQAKKNVFAHQDGSGKVVLNYDNDITRAFAADAPGAVEFFSRQARPAHGVYLEDGTIFRDGRPIMDAADIRIPGVHNIENYMAAACAVEGLATDEDIDAVARSYVGVLNRIIAAKPADLTLTMHICRGNFRSTWFSSGGYEPIAEILFANCPVDGFFLEYDSERSGGFEPLRFIKDQTVVLGLITSKFPELEDKEAVKARIAEAAKYVPLVQLCLSPQCGFSSTEEGNIMTEEEQWAKVRLVVEIAREVWQDA